ncbi:MAG: MlaA family lipoprotein [Gammaproteobacteria bacterium]
MSPHTLANRSFFPAPLLFAAFLTGCAGSATPRISQDDDAWEGWNRGAQVFNDSLDDAVMKPLAKGYQAVTPEPVDEGVTHFFSNLGDIGVSINDLLQFKILQGGMDFSRFLINTTAGVAGFFDVAQKIGLPKHNEDFGQTLGVWGVPSGTYLVLPFFGPSSPRDAAGLLGDALLNPLTYVSVFGGAAVNAATAGSKVLDVTDTRAGLLSSEKILDEAAIDRYEFIKNAYRQQREYLIYDGSPPESAEDELLLEEELDRTPPDTGGANTSAEPSASENAPIVTRGGIELGDQNRNPDEAPVVDHSRHLLELSAPE